MKIGFHVPIGKGWEKAISYAESTGCETIQAFCHNPRSWEGFSKKKGIKEIISKSRIKPLILHSAYVVNLASSLYGEKSVELLLREREKGKEWGAEYLIFHPGSGEKEILYKNLEKLSGDFSTPPYLTVENSSGGKKLGKTLSEIEEVLLKFPFLRFCLDTAHLFQEGGDFSSGEGREKIFSTLSKEIFKRRIKVLHLNDSLTPLSSHIDRHYHIGKGKIGEEGMREIIRYFLNKEIYLIMETPGIGSKWDFINMKKVKSIIEEIRNG